MSKIVKKQALIGEEIELFANSGEQIERVDSNYPVNYVDIISLDGLDGEPVTPTAGTFSIYVKTSDSGGYKALSDNGELSADLTGGSSLVDGVAEGASFYGNPFGIKIVPVGVDVAAAYEVIIKQNM